MVKHKLLSSPLEVFASSTTRRRVWGGRLAGVDPSYSLLFLRKIATASSFFFEQNVDLPFDVPSRKKKPFLTPLTEVIKKKKKNSEGTALRPPENGLLVEGLIPVAHDTLKARAIVLSGAQSLLKAFPVKTCRYCREVHVGPVGHQIASCQGRYNGPRRGRHDWTAGDIHDVLPSMNVFHLSDRLAKPITHADRLRIDRLPAVVELCIQAGVDVPGYPIKRRTQPVSMIRKKPMDFDDLDIVERSRMARAKKYVETAACSPGSNDTMEISSMNAVEISKLADKTLKAWNAMRSGAERLMGKYSVQVCGYCPEVHVGPKSPKTRDCMAFKHQMRAGHHGWQEVSIDDLIPPKYVWHLRDLTGPPLTTELRVFYGVAPAIVELCVQAGAAIPDRYKPMMRLDVVISDMNEVDKVA